MKLPRWLVLSIASLCLWVPLLSAGVWWFNWPMYTAYSFVDSVGSADIELAKHLVGLPEPDDPDEHGIIIHRSTDNPATWALLKNAEQLCPECRSNYFKATDVQMLPRHLFDVMLGRQRFILRPGSSYVFFAERGHVCDGPD